MLGLYYAELKVVFEHDSVYASFIKKGLDFFSYICVVPTRYPKKIKHF